MTQVDAFTVLASDRCICGNAKPNGRSYRRAFCVRCYSGLTDTLQRRLFKGVGDGFEQAYVEAVQWLAERAAARKQGGEKS